MHGMHLEDLIGRLRRGGLDPTAEEVADAVWLSRWLDPAPPRAERDRRPADPSAPPENGTGPTIRSPADHTPGTGQEPRPAGRHVRPGHQAAEDRRPAHGH
ncbi:hypothetical protein O3Q52_49430, partial [Streptomyces sp. ActVer]|uniref:hypothetical protein n=1 Tax=Streptomyces sp. ActVer TaxID=3014558 RepID=UPI0022B548BA